MKAACTVTKQPNGDWRVSHSSSLLGTVEISARSRDEALTKMRDELQYRSEYCPCSGASEDRVEIEVSEERLGVAD